MNLYCCTVEALLYVRAEDRDEAKQLAIIDRAIGAIPCADRCASQWCACGARPIHAPDIACKNPKALPCDCSRRRMVKEVWG